MRRKSISRVVFFQFVYSTASSILNFLSIALIIKSFSLSVYGEYSLLLNSIFLVSIFCGGWFTQFILQNFAETIFFRYRIYIVTKYFSLIAFSLEFLLAQMLGHNLFISLIASSIAFLHYIYSINVALNFSTLNIKRNFVLDLSKNLVFLSAIVFCLFYLKSDRNLPLLLYLNLLSLAVSYIIILRHSGIRGNIFKFSIWEIKVVLKKGVLFPGIYLALWFFFSYLLNIVDKYLLGRYFGSINLGIYSSAFDISTRVISFLFLPISYVYLPILKKIHLSGNYNRVKKITKIKLLTDLIILIIFLILGYLTYDKEISLFTVTFKVSQFIIIMISSALVFQMALTAQKNMEINTRNKDLMVIMFIVLLFNVLGNIFVTPRFGMVYASWVSFFTSFLYLALILISSQKTNQYFKNYEENS